MNTYIALLYSVGVAPGRRVVMEDLKAMAAGLGFTAPRTIASTGNLIFETEQAEDGALTARLETAFARQFGLHVDILLRSADEWRRLAAGNPFPEEAARDGASVHVRVMRSAPADTVVEALRPRAKAGERMTLIGRDLWVHFPEEPNRSRLLPALTPRHLGIGTLRNANIVGKIAEAF